MESRKTSLVTGSTAGIGKSIAIGLAGLGFNVIANGRREPSAVRDVISEIEAKSVECTYVQGDVSRPDARQAIIEAVKASGGLDVLVNNAGITTAGRKDILELTEQDIQAVMGVNLVGPMLLTSALVPFMKGRPDRTYIINIASISSYAVSVNRADYCITKAGVSMMTQLFAARLAGESIGVFEIRPGIISTDMTSGSREKYDSLIEGGLLLIPRWGQGNDVARAIEAIVLDYFPYSTGEVINVDGGFNIRRL